MLLRYLVKFKWIVQITNRITDQLITDISFRYLLEFETNVIRRFAKVSIVSYSRPSLIIIESVSQLHVYLLWGQCLFSIVS